MSFDALDEFLGVCSKIMLSVENTNLLLSVLSIVHIVQ